MVVSRKYGIVVRFFGLHLVKDLNLDYRARVYGILEENIDNNDFPINHICWEMSIGRTNL